MDTSQAPCRDNPDLWFSNNPFQKAKAKRICETCPLKLACAELGKGEEWGLWGGEEKVAPDLSLKAVRIERDSDIRALKSEGHNHTEISRRLNIPRSTVVYVVQQAA